jgi:hypothetical protein
LFLHLGLYLPSLVFWWLLLLESDEGHWTKCKWQSQEHLGPWQHGWWRHGCN